MRKWKIGTLILASVLLFGFLQETDRQDIFKASYLANGGFERVLSGWVFTGGTVTNATSGANLMTGNGSITWDSDAAAQTLSESFNLPLGARGTRGRAFCKIHVPSGTATHTLSFVNGGTTTKVVNSSAQNAYTYVDFTFDNSIVSAEIRLTSVNANEPLIAVDDCHVVQANDAVTSISHNGAYTIGIARLNCDAASAITYQDGTWISTIGNIVAGACSVTIATGAFATAPVCQVVTETGSGADPVNVGFTAAPTTTNVTVDCDTDTGADCTVNDFELICVGTR